MKIYFLNIFTMSNTSPSVKPIDEILHEFNQSRYDVAPKVPFRAFNTGPSGRGKSILLMVFSLVYTSGHLQLRAAPGHRGAYLG